jgi:hypothetical protein
VHQRREPTTKVQVTRPFRFFVGDYHLACPREGDTLEGAIAEFALARGHGQLVPESAVETGSEGALVPEHAG